MTLHTDYLEDQVHFRAYSNFPHFIVRSEVRIFNPDQSVRDKPLEVIAMDKDGTANGRRNSQSIPRRDAISSMCCACTTRRTILMRRRHSHYG